MTVLPSSQEQQPFTVPARVVLNDISQTGLLIFISDPLVAGQRVEVTIPEPHRFSVKGKVTACQQMIMDRKIISDHQFAFRAAIEFEIENAEDRDRVNAYFDVVQEAYLKAA